MSNEQNKPLNCDRVITTKNGEFTCKHGLPRNIGEFEGKRVYQCVNNYYIDDKRVSINIIRFYMDNVRKVLHSIDDDPALIVLKSSSYYGGDSKSDSEVLSIYQREWYHCGVLHGSDGLPASETYHLNGNMRIQKWYTHGAIPREGIIYREFDDDGLTVLKEFYAHQLDEYIKTSEEFKDMITFQEVNPGELVIL